MLEYYCPSLARRAVQEQNVLTAFLHEAACRFRADRYSDTYAYECLRNMVHFGKWLRAYGISAESVTQEHVERFVKESVPRVGPSATERRGQLYKALHFLLRLIREKHPVMTRPSIVQLETGRYIEHLLRNRGLGEGTIANHRRALEKFLSAFCRQGPLDLSQVTAARLLSYLMDLPRTPTDGQRRHACTAVRGYLRFLQLRGAPVAPLLTVIPRIPVPRRAVPPQVLTPAELKQLLKALDHSRPTGRRDYAAVLCMADLGMRGRDVPRLMLDDIDWRQGTVCVANHKGGLPYRMPLPRRLGLALADYLKCERPPSKRREVFLGYGHPRDVPMTARALPSSVYRAWKRSGLAGRFRGMHILRHTVATRMKQKGVALKVIADVLGHRSLQSTTLYAQVDLPALRKIAQSWPEGQP
jgi:site-specific recombinase XerD